MSRTSLNPKVRFEVLARDGFTCCYCGAAAPSVRLHVDHVIPVSQGGTDAIDNLATSCEQCNLGKGQVTVDQFIARNARTADPAEDIDAIASDCGSEREAMKVSLRMAGMHMADVAAQLGVSRNAVRLWVIKGIPRARVRDFCRVTGTTLLERYLAISADPETEEGRVAMISSRSRAA